MTLSWCRSATIAVILILAGCGGAHSGRPESDATPLQLVSNLHGTNDYHYNCAVNVSYLTLRAFDRECSVQGIGKTLGAGESMEKLCSFLDIKRLLVANRLTVGAYRFESPEGIPGSLKSRDVALVRLGGIDPTSAHFIVLLKRANGDFVWIDPPGENSVADNSLVVSWLKQSGATGEVLIVSEGLSAEQSRSPSIDVKSEIDVGEVSNG